MAEVDTTGSEKKTAGTTDDSVSYSPDWTDRDFVDIGACVDVKSLNDARIAVDDYPTEGPDGTVTLHLRQQSRLIEGKFILGADEAEWLAEQLRDHAANVRQGDNSENQQTEPAK